MGSDGSGSTGLQFISAHTSQMTIICPGNHKEKLFPQRANRVGRRPSNLRLFWQHFTSVIKLEGQTEREREPPPSPLLTERSRRKGKNLGLLPIPRLQSRRHLDNGHGYQEAPAWFKYFIKVQIILTVNMMIIVCFNVWCQSSNL